MIVLRIVISYGQLQVSEMPHINAMYCNALRIYCMSLSPPTPPFLKLIIFLREFSTFYPFLEMGIYLIKNCENLWECGVLYFLLIFLPMSR